MVSAARNALKITVPGLVNVTTPVDASIDAPVAVDPVPRAQVIAPVPDPPVAVAAYAVPKLPVADELIENRDVVTI